MCIVADIYPRDSGLAERLRVLFNVASPSLLTINTYIVLLQCLYRSTLPTKQKTTFVYIHLFHKPCEPFGIYGVLRMHPSDMVVRSQCIRQRQMWTIAYGIHFMHSVPSSTTTTTTKNENNKTSRPETFRLQAKWDGKGTQALEKQHFSCTTSSRCVYVWSHIYRVRQKGGYLLL